MSNFNMYFMQNRTTFMERLSERLTAIEAVLKKLEPVEGLLERVALLENTIYTTKKVFTFQEACMYIGVSESMLYKLTSNKEIPHYKPRGKMLYFAKEELDAAQNAMNKLCLGARLIEYPCAWGERYVIAAKKLAPTPKAYPRKAGTAGKLPL